MPALPEKTRKFIAKYGEMASHWGLSRTECQIHGLLFVSPEPLDAEEISKSLEVARSHVSNSLKELQNWGIIKVVHKIGSRREFFECEKDVWNLFRTVVSEQKRREIDPWMRILKETAQDMGEDGESTAFARKRILEMYEFFDVFSKWYEEVRKLPTPMVRRFLALGGKALSLLGLKGG